MHRLFIAIILITLSGVLNTALSQQTQIELEIFEPGVISLPDIRETSPSFTSDGQTMVFARTTNWKDKIPYIAEKTENGWEAQQITFVDTVYNIAIDPKGDTIFYKAYEMQDTTEVSKVYKVEKEGNDWGEPVEQIALFNINAGYFCPVTDGTLYMFARGPEKPGIYRSEIQSDGSYGSPVWLSNSVSLPNTTTFDLFINSTEDKLIVTRAGLDESQSERIGPRGFFYFEKINNEWTEITRIDQLPYGWGATVLTDKRFLFVEEGDLQFVEMNELGIHW
jgi:hypothetical protein